MRSGTAIGNTGYNRCYVPPDSSQLLLVVTALLIAFEMPVVLSWSTPAFNAIEPPRINKSHHSIWYLDGYNLLAHKGTCRKDPDVLLKHLLPITQSRTGNNQRTVYLVLDSQGEHTTTTLHAMNHNNDSTADRLVQVKVRAEESADAFIVNHVTQLPPGLHRVHVVTADRELRQLVLQQQQGRSNQIKVIHPVTFWKRYLPRLSGFKKQLN
jgi:predicted RNA-binding protein with PIN domain